MNATKLNRLLKKSMISLWGGAPILTQKWMAQAECSLDDAKYVSRSISNLIKQHQFDEKEYGKAETAIIKSAETTLSSGGAIFSAEWISDQAYSYDQAHSAAKYIALAINTHHFYGEHSFA